MVMGLLDIEDPQVIHDYKASGKKGPKNIVISFDGTGAKPERGVQKDGTPELYTGADGLSNVCKLHLYAGGNIGNTYQEFEDQLPFYYSGVGTRGPMTLQMITGMLPSYAAGFSMEYIARKACDDMEPIYNKGDKIFVFGFSRGAATARLFVSYLSKRDWCDSIEFLGVYDTVLSTLRYGVTGNIKNMDSEFWRWNKSSKLPDIVQHVVHFMAIDEYRVNFNPTHFNDNPNVKEIWVSGAHTDVGGGYYHDGISDTILQCMKIETAKYGLKFREITEETCTKFHSTLIDPKVTGIDAQLFANYDKDMQMGPDPLDPDVHDSMNTGFMRLAYTTFNLVFGNYKQRTIRKVKDDKTFEGEPILLLDLTVERVKGWKPEGEPELGQAYASGKYRPEHLKGIKYKLVSSLDMSISDTVYDGIENVVEDW